MASPKAPSSSPDENKSPANESEGAEQIPTKRTLDEANNGDAESDQQSPSAKSLKTENEKQECREDSKESEEDVQEAKGTEKKTLSEITSPSVGIFTSTKEYTSPFSLLAQTNTSDGFFKVQQEKTPEPEETDLEPKSAPNTTILTNELPPDEKIGFECKTCSLSHFKDGEWTAPQPVVLHFIVKEADKKSLRIACYQLGSGRIQLNSQMLPSMSINELKTRSIIFNAQLLSNESKLAPHRIIFPDKESRDKCLEYYKGLSLDA